MILSLSALPYSGREFFAARGKIMLITFTVIGFVVVIIAVIRGSRLQELSFNLKFHSDKSTRKQIEK